MGFLLKTVLFLVGGFLLDLLVEWIPWLVSKLGAKFIGTALIVFCYWFMSEYFVELIGYAASAVNYFLEYFFSIDLFDIILGLFPEQGSSIGWGMQLVKESYYFMREWIAFDYLKVFINSYINLYFTVIGCRIVFKLYYTHYIPWCHSMMK